MTDNKTDDTRDRRMSVSEAARYLGIGEDAVRKRIYRGKIRYERDEQGRYYVFPDREPPTDHRTDRTDRTSRQDRLVRSLEDQNRFLRQLLEESNRAQAEQRRIIAALTSRLPELESPLEATGSPETPSEPGPSEATGTPPEAQTGTERLPWWRRVFGG